MRWRPSTIAVSAVAAAVALGGCFDGTVRSPRETAETPPRAQGRHAHRQNGPGPGRERPGQTISFAAVGDVAMGITPTLPPEPAAYFDPIEPDLKADVVFANLEGTLTDVSESPKCGPGSHECFAFRAPPEYAKYLHAAGFRIMSNANNHSFDFGEAGEEETIEALHDAGIAQTGLPGQIKLLAVDGLKVAFLGFAPYSNTASLTDLEGARSLIARATRAADIVVVAIHAGAEGTDAQHVTGEEETYLGEDRGNAEEFAHAAIDAGADLILGSGPHVLRGMEVYRGRLVAYSLGNFSGYHNFSLEGPLGQTVVLHATLDPDGRLLGGRLDSVALVEAGQPVPDPEGAGAALIAQLSREDFGPHAVRVGAGGRLSRP